MLIVTNLNAVNEIFNSKAPRPWREVVLEVYPEATEDCNGRFHAPYDGYECSLTGKTFRGGEYLPMTEPEDNYRVFGSERKFPTAIDLEGNEHSWDGTRAQNLAVWGELFSQTNEHDRLTSKHVGTVGDKIEFQAILNFVKGFHGYYGITWIHVFKDSQGNVIVYKGTKKLGDKDSILTVKAKIKTHGERENVKQTIIERPKVVEVTH